MKTAIASSLAFLPLLAITSAFEVSDTYKKSLGNSDCTSILLEDAHVLRATCTDPGPRTKVDLTLDLNTCFANYLGTLNHVPHGSGGFAESCKFCHLDRTSLVCECSAGAGHGLRHSAVELADWNVIQFTEGKLYCDSTEGLTKRAAGRRKHLEFETILHMVGGGGLGQINQ
ncbi:hypothetical protein M426DRAFT_24461 [Hypoxylon sp. CI-4A]|nr:hypothetical protein M426DRAFT_24461 [Hypoxylon sp. CI-4A]